VRNAETLPFSNFMSICVMRALSTEARDHGNNMEGPHPPRFRATAGEHPQFGNAKLNPGR
jgi:hypothetical protein